MPISLILGHPRAGSFCHAIADTARAALEASGHAVAIHDLQAEGFDPVMTAEEWRTRRSTNALVEQHCREIAAADGLVVVHPNWWGGPPAIVKGWIDRVLRPGVAYDLLPPDAGGASRLVGRLREAAVVFTTSDAPREVERTQFGDSVAPAWRDCVAALCGMWRFEHRVFSGLGRSTPEQRAGWLAETGVVVRDLFPAASAARTASTG